MRYMYTYTMEAIVFIIIDMVIRVKQFQTMGPHLVLLFPGRVKTYAGENLIHLESTKTSPCSK